MPGSGPGGRWFKSNRPDQTFRISKLQNWKSKERLVRSHALLFKCEEKGRRSRLNSLSCSEDALDDDPILGAVGYWKSL